MTLLVRIKVHAQQVCGLAWSPSGTCFATGGNDNLCCLFPVSKVLEDQGDERLAAETRAKEPVLTLKAGQKHPESPISPFHGAGHLFTGGGAGHDNSPKMPKSGYFGSGYPASPSSSSGGLVAASQTVDELRYPPTTQAPSSVVRYLPAGSEKHRWRHAAAVKAIAFCPWREGLIATGGGSNDKCIHFFHTTSGAALATISVAAQVTALIWSTTRREIAATFGYAQPDHAYRIAVFSWPECRQVAAIPWEGEHRALYAVAYPGGPSDTYRTKERLKSRTAEEGCIVVASSDESVKFHEVWLAERKATALGSGVLAGSDILEMEEGIDKEGDVIR